MPPPTLNIVQTKGQGSVKVFKLYDGVTLGEQVGGVAAASIETPLPAEAARALCANQYIEAFGKSFICVNTDICEKDQGGAGNWGSVHSLDPNVYGGGTAHSGLHLLHPGGIPTLAMMYMTGGAVDQTRLVTSTDGVTWTETVLRGSVTSSGPIGNAVVFRNSLFWAGLFGSTYQIVEHDLVLSATRFYTPSNWNSAGLVDLYVHDNKLFALTNYDALGYMRLWRLEGTAFVDVMYFSQPVTSNTGARACMVSDGSDLICLGVDGSPVGLVAFAVSNPTTILSQTWPSADVTDVTTPVIPVNYRAGGVYASLANPSGWRRYVDVDTVAGTATTYLWMNLGTPDSGDFHCFQFVNQSTVLTDLGSGVAVDLFALPTSGDGGLGRIPCDPSGRLELEGPPVEVAGGYTKRYFRCYGTGAAFNAGLFFNVDEEAPATQATLVTGSLTIESGTPPTTPTIPGTDKIQNITPDGGATLYSFQHNSNADGIAEGQGYTSVLRPVA